MLELKNITPVKVSSEGYRRETLVNHKSGGFGPCRGCIVLLMRLASAVGREVHYPLRYQRPAAAARYLRNVLKIVAIRTPDPIENYWFPIVI